MAWPGHLLTGGRGVLCGDCGTLAATRVSRQPPPAAPDADLLHRFLSNCSAHHTVRPATAVVPARKFPRPGGPQARTADPHTRQQPAVLHCLRNEAERTDERTAAGQVPSIPRRPRLRYGRLLRPGPGR